MSSWASNPKEKLLFENWRSYLTEDKKVAGINSTVYPDSLINILNRLKDILEPGQINYLINFFLARTKEDRIVLEAIGDRQRDPRTFSPETTMGLNKIIQSFELQPKEQQRLEKALNFWARVNTVKFSQTQDSQVTTTEPEESDFQTMDTMEPEDSDSKQKPAEDEDETRDTKTEELEDRFQSIVDKYVGDFLEKGNAEIELGKVREAFNGVAEVIPLNGTKKENNTDEAYFSDDSRLDGEKSDKAYYAYAIKFGDKIYLMPNVKRTLHFGFYFEFSGDRYKNDEFGKNFVIQKLPTGFMNSINDFEMTDKGKLLAAANIRSNVNEVKSMIAEIRNIIKQTRRLNEEE